MAAQILPDLFYPQKLRVATELLEPRKGGA
jgi:hypothetical protein